MFRLKNHICWLILLNKPGFASCVALLFLADRSLEPALLVAVIDLETFVDDTEIFKYNLNKEQANEIKIKINKWDGSNEI